MLSSLSNYFRTAYGFFRHPRRKIDATALNQNSIWFCVAAIIIYALLFDAILYFREWQYLETHDFFTTFGTKIPLSLFYMATGFIINWVLLRLFGKKLTSGEFSKYFSIFYLIIFIGILDVGFKVKFIISEAIFDIIYAFYYYLLLRHTYELTKGRTAAVISIDIVTSLIIRIAVAYFIDHI